MTISSSSCRRPGGSRLTKLVGWLHLKQHVTHTTHFVHLDRMVFDIPALPGA